MYPRKWAELAVVISGPHKGYLFLIEPNEDVLTRLRDNIAIIVVARKFGDLLEYLSKDRFYERNYLVSGRRLNFDLYTKKVCSILNVVYEATRVIFSNLIYNIY